MLKDKVLELQQNPRFHALFDEGIRNLDSSTIFQILRELGRPKIVFEGKDINAMAIQGAWSAGFNDCLDHLIYYKQLLEPDSAAKPNLEFGALDKAVEKGDLSREELHAIRTGQPVDYSKYIKPNSASADSGVKK